MTCLMLELRNLSLSLSLSCDLFTIRTEDCDFEFEVIYATCFLFRLKITLEIQQKVSVTRFSLFNLSNSLKQQNATKKNLQRIYNCVFLEHAV